MKDKPHKMLGTVTGRVTSTSPNCWELDPELFPKSETRKLFTPDTHRTFIAADLSTIGDDFLRIMTKTQPSLRDRLKALPSPKAIDALIEEAEKLPYIGKQTLRRLKRLAEDKKAQIAKRAEKKGVNK